MLHIETYTANIVIDAKAKLGEGPSWDQRFQRLFWVDIKGFQLHIYDPSTCTDRTINVGEHIGAVVPYLKNKVIVALISGLYCLDIETGAKVLIHDPEEGRLGNRFNDGKCDPAGRFLAGTMSLNGEHAQGALYSLNTKGKVSLLVGKASISNGLAWSADHRTMYYIDTPTLEVVSFDYDVVQGTIRNKQLVARLDESEGYPDGMTIDAEGMLWVARWGGKRVSRIHPAHGEVIAEVSLPVNCVTSCAFGGEQLDELYITTAQDDDSADQPLAGGLFMVKTGVKGTPTSYFNQGQTANWLERLVK
ncbi:SMP-30/gluconolactonase/LRE family protein [Paenibacillus sp. SEL3]|uniref:SMP-30/gluconolactonase/LRE family protein n=1 Tax=Paenibacillus polymyxa TaxID=1406 RepID=A0A8I1J4F6_PAEPO|nr:MULTISPECIES: SMP-30/gluconolactonase/LRE family protein [Paenibacillus]KAF6576035.1 SMP-30/gluconolactonase/LRE family protein [Paenibacillus sp. EKM206P]KAF6589669.1 SMP-30/gluconolactonase/LRE family protein [Paenibacillus sp. EKM205P]MBM0633306.1 SMP-30/gluconolactonase/LRE family protein [Paenibacillus polymyxa]